LNGFTLKEIRLLLIEDNTLLREGIIASLEPYKDLVIIPISWSGENFLEKIKSIKPDLILINFESQNKSNFHFIETIKRELPKSKIIVMNLVPGSADVLQFVKAGANGFILKVGSLNDLLLAIRTVTEGSAVLPPLLTDPLFSQIVNNSIKDNKSKLKKAAIFTKREQEVIKLISNGLRNKDIGQELNISPYTVKTHIHNIMEKLSLHTRLEIANYSYSQKQIDF